MEEKILRTEDKENNKTVVLEREETGAILRARINEGVDLFTAYQIEMWRSMSITL